MNRGIVDLQPSQHYFDRHIGQWLVWVPVEAVATAPSAATPRIAKVNFRIEPNVAMPT